MRFLSQDLNYGADGTTDLAEGAQRSIASGGVKVGSPFAGHLAKTRDNGVVVKDFD